MDAYAKLALCTEGTGFEVDDEALSVHPGSNPDQHGRSDDLRSGGETGEGRTLRTQDDLPIYRAALPNGKRVPILKTLLTSVCENNCSYCFSRAGRDCERHTFKPDELAKTYMQIYEAGIVRGVFLSSGIYDGGIKTQDRLLATAEILRKKHQYNGYMHLKIMPGAEKAQVERSMELADRLSINLEAPTSHRLATLAPQKTMIEELLAPLQWVNDLRRYDSMGKGWHDRWPSSTTQFVVGAGEETDLELLRMSEYLFSHLMLARVYYSSFKPIIGTPLENKPAENVWRRHRLYQASFLLKQYPFSLEDIPIDQSGNLSLEVDPKLAWARTHLIETPVEVNRACLHELMRIPGIGERGANSIIKIRREGRIIDANQLSGKGIHLTRAVPFILINGRRPVHQLSLWAESSLLC